MIMNREEYMDRCREPLQGCENVSESESDPTTQDKKKFAMSLEDLKDGKVITTGNSNV